MVQLTECHSGCHYWYFIKHHVVPSCAKYMSKTRLKKKKKQCALVFIAAALALVVATVIKSPTDSQCVNASDSQGVREVRARRFEDCGQRQSRQSAASHHARASQRDGRSVTSPPMAQTALHCQTRPVSAVNGRPLLIVRHHWPRPSSSAFTILKDLFFFFFFLQGFA